MKEILFSFFILLCLMGLSCIKSADLVSTEKIYKAQDVDIHTLQYAKIPKEDYFELWEEELELGRSLTNLQEFLDDRFFHEIKDQISKYIDTDLRLYADIYSPPYEYKAPLIVFMHGGAFVKGRRDNEYMKKMCMAFAQRGYKVASIDYRKMSLFNPSVLKTAYLAMQDVHMALDFFMMNADSLKIDTENIFLGGISAGAVTAMNVAYYDAHENILDRKQKLENLYGAVDHKLPEIKPRIKGVINIAGGIFDLGILDNPISCFSYHGSQDDVIRMDYDYPFVHETKAYHGLVGDLQSIFQDNTAIVNELEDAKMFKIYGSYAIHQRLRKDSEIYAQLQILEGEDHYFMFSRNQTLTSKGIEVINDIAEKLYLLISN